VKVLEGTELDGRRERKRNPKGMKNKKTADEEGMDDKV